MPKVWNVGNTTVRNPYRIEGGLKVFAEEGFEGNVHGEQAETRLTRRLKANEVLQSSGANEALYGRKWRGVFVKLGFITDQEFKIGDSKYDHTAFANEFATDLELEALKYELTPVGQRLLNASTLPEKQEIFLRQFIRHEVPSGHERGFPPEQKMKPFILFIQVLRELEDRGLKGLNKFETGAFIQPFQDHTPQLYSELVDQIADYRQKRSGFANKVEKRKFDKTFLKAQADNYGVKPGTIHTYGDTTFRYFGLTGVFSKSRNRIVIRDSRRDLANRILEEEPEFLFNNNPLEYYLQFYGGTTPLPTDDVDFAASQIVDLRERIAALDATISIEDLPDGQSIQDIQKKRHELTQILNEEREKVYAIEQQNADNIVETIEYLEKITNNRLHSHLEIYDYPAYLEWATWRAFLAIDNFAVPAHETRRFPVDEDFFPTNTAPGGGADLIFEFDDFKLVVEVTLTTGERQLVAEGEPVRRHVSNHYLEGDIRKHTYCLFIAPSISNNIAETYRLGTYYRGEERETQYIVPMTISEFTELIRALTARRYTPQEFRRLLENCLAHRELNAPEWKATIGAISQDWIQQVIRPQA